VHDEPPPKLAAGPFLRSRSSSWRVAKKLSAMGCPRASPTVPIDPEQTALAEALTERPGGVLGFVVGVVDQLSRFRPPPHGGHLQASTTSKGRR